MSEPKIKHLTALLVAPGLAAAQSATNAPTQLPEMVVQGQSEPSFKVDQVSSPKFTQPLVDTPQTIIALPKEVYLQQGAQTLSDVLRNTPGISFAAGEGGNVASGDSFFMRGSDASGNIFVDGVRDSGAYSRDVFDIEQVEIFKGPTGADTGRGGSSGYINMATKTPLLQKSYFSTLAYGSANNLRGTLDANQPFGWGEAGDWRHGAALRLNLMGQEGSVPGRDIVENNRWGVSPSLAFGLGTPTRLYFGGSFVEQDNVPDSGLPVAALPGGVLGRVDQSNFYGLADEDYDRVTSGRVLGRVEHDFSDSFTLRNQFVYARTDRDALTSYIQNATTNSIDVVNGIVTPRRTHVETENEIFSEQINATLKFDTWKFEHNLSSGVELTRESQFAPTWAATNGPATSVYSPDPFRPAALNQIPARLNGAYTDGTIDTAAAYAFDTIKLNEHFLVNGSLRAEHYQIDYDSVSTAGAPLAVETDDTLLSWKAGLVYKPVENGSFYAAYANSFTPPGTSFTLATNVNSANNPIFDAQESVNYEVGTKWEFFNQRLLTGLAVYRSENRNNLVQDTTTLQYVQDADNILHGVELNLTGKITDRWMIQAGAGYTHSEYRAPAGTSGAGNNGATLRFTPEWSASLWTTYKFKSGLTIGGGPVYSASVARSTTGAPVVTTTAAAEAPDFLLWNAMAAYEFNENFTLRLNINNLTDESYYILNNNGGRYYNGAPRSFTLTAELRF